MAETVRANRCPAAGNPKAEDRPAALARQRGERPKEIRNWMASEAYWTADYADYTDKIRAIRVIRGQ